MEERRLPPTILNDGLDDSELKIHPEMIAPEEVEYEKGLKIVIAFNTH